MARPRSFNEEDVIDVTLRLFANRGFNAASLDDLVEATGLLRGSIYKAFGSKLNLFLLGFKSCADSFDIENELHLDILTVALRDLAEVDEQTRELCKQIIQSSDVSLNVKLGNNLIKRLEK